jgi:hypothetical protein
LETTGLEELRFQPEPELTSRSESLRLAGSLIEREGAHAWQGIGPATSK